MVPHTFLFIIHTGSRRLGSSNFRNSSYKGKTTGSAHVSRLSSRFLWLWLKKQLSNHLNWLLFRSKLVNWLLFQSRLPLLQLYIETVDPVTFSFKILMLNTFPIKTVKLANFSLFKTVTFTTISFKTVYFTPFLFETVKLATFFTLSKLASSPVFHSKLSSFLLSFKTV